VSRYDNIIDFGIELLDWLNTTLQTAYNKIEECSDGIAYLLLFEVMYPGSVALTRINYNAFYPLEKKNNLQLLQRLFAQLGIPHTIPFDKISNAKLQDNIEFLQWIFTFAAKNFETLNLDGVYERREEAVVTLGKKNKIFPPLNFIKNEDSRMKLFPNYTTLTYSDPTKDYLFDQVSEEEIQLPHKAEDIQHFADALEQEIMLKLARNEEKYNLIHSLLEERNFLFDKLLLVEGICTVRESDTDENNETARNFLVRLLEAKII